MKKNESFKHLYSIGSPKLQSKINYKSSIIKSLNPKKSTGPDSIYIKVIRIALKVIEFHLYNAINKDLEKSKYYGETQAALGRAINIKKKRSNRNRKL